MNKAERERQALLNFGKNLSGTQDVPAWLTDNPIVAENEKEARELLITLLTPTLEGNN